MKRFMPEAKLIWMDTGKSQMQQHFTPSNDVDKLQYLTGEVPFHGHWKCLDVAKDLCYFGLETK